MGVEIPLREETILEVFGPIEKHWVSCGVCSKTGHSDINNGIQQKESFSPRFAIRIVVKTYKLHQVSSG